jgi:peptidyl-dipeptidase A
LSAFRGNRHIIESARRLLGMRQELNDLDFRQLDKILLNAAESPGGIPEVVQARIEAETRLMELADGFVYCLEGTGSDCRKPVSLEEIDEALGASRDLGQRRKYWEASKQNGAALKRGLAELRDLRNRISAELGYTSYFHLQVADYGMSVEEMIQLMDQTVAETKPLYDQLHRYARRKLGERYKQPPPERIPAHWLADRWGQAWPELTDAADLDGHFKNRQPRWIIEQAERFYTSLGWPSLPKSFWANSDLYLVRSDSARKKNPNASAWHVDLDHDVRSLMSVVPNARWFKSAHHELAHIHYFLAYSNSKTPIVLREGLNRAFHEAVGELMGLAAGQEPYLRQSGVLSASVKLDPAEGLLAEALDNAVVFLPWSAGAMTHFEYELYEKRLPADQFNKRWWELVAQYQGVAPPAVRGEDYCDACTKNNLIEDAAQYYDHAVAMLLKYQLHDYIARKILNQDPRRCNYAGSKEAGRWLHEILSLGATRDWRQVIKEKTGEDLSPQAMVEYFRPLEEHLAKVNGEISAAGAASAGLRR